MNTSFISGWDIGGAHIKLARCTTAGQLVTVQQVPCPLWKGLAQLDQAIRSLLQQSDNRSDLHAITMTGELADIFPDRKTGVIHILQCLSRHIPAERIMVYAAEQGWLSIEAAAGYWQHVASRNWQASATLLARQHAQGIFLDLGSTTCDMITFEHGRVTALGYSDFERQRSRELLYTGAIRTPLIAISQQAPFNGQLMTLAAEIFATTADIWCLLDELDATTIQDDSADGQAWDHASCMRRLARMLGTDASQASAIQWQYLARWFAHQQVHQICEAMLQLLSAHPELPQDTPLIGAGVGRFIIKHCAQHLHRPYLDYAQSLDLELPQAADHAPAVAMALLARQDLS